MRSLSDHAFLTRKQALVVALIAALAGLAGAVIQRSSGPAITQAWIRIKGVELDETILGTKVRVVIKVDGNAYSYPSRAVWAKVSPHMSMEEFPLPVGKKEYRVSFEMFQIDDRGESEHYQSREIVTVREFPFESEYKLFLPFSRTGVGLFGGGPSTARIKFEIRSDL